MAGFFAAAAKTPFSTLIMVSELTGNYNLLLPTLWVCTMSFLFSDLQRPWRGHRHGAVALHHPADDRGDFVNAERDHDQAVRERRGGAGYRGRGGRRPVRGRSCLQPRRRGVAGAYGFSDTWAIRSRTGALSACCRCRRPEHIAGISKTGYAPATPRGLDWRHVQRRTDANSGPKRPVAGTRVPPGRPRTGNYDLRMRAGRGGLFPADGARLWRAASYHGGSGVGSQYRARRGEPMH